MARHTQLVWTQPAIDSLLEIVRHVQADNPTAAHRFAEQIKSKVSRLAAFPDSGRIVPEFPGSGLREIIVGNYQIIFRAAKRPPRVEILTVRHGARLLSEAPESH
jgi:plasmid stabilization system protein ParE